MKKGMIALAATATLLLSGVVGVAVAGTANATGDHDKQWILHPVSGKGETKTGYNCIRPDEASKHIDQYGNPKHEADGRVDKYDTEGLCTEVPGPTVTVTGPVVTVTVPGPTDTVTLPGSTVTVPGSTSTTTLPDSTVTLPGSTVTLPGSTVTVPGETTTETLPDVVTTVPGKTTTQTGEAQVVTVAGKTSTITGKPVVVRSASKELAFTGSDFRSPITWVVILLLAGIAAYGWKKALGGGAHR